MYSLSWLHIPTSSSYISIASTKKFPYKSIREKIWPCHKIIQGQPKTIIWTNFVGFQYPMLYTRFFLYTKFQAHWSVGFGVEDFWRDFAIYGHGGHLGHMTRIIDQTFIPPSHWGSTWNLALIGRGFWEDVWRVDYGRMDDGACLYYKLTHEPNGSGELKIAPQRAVLRLPRKKSQVKVISFIIFICDLQYVCVYQTYTVYTVALVVCE